MSIVIIQKMIMLSVLLCTIVLGLMSMHHGDWSLGLLLLLGKAEEFISHHSHAAHDAQHIALHKRHGP